MPSRTEPPAQAYTLSKGRRLDVHEYGDARGIRVLFFHGWPSSGTQGELIDAAARKLGMRIIAPSRPGLSESTFVPDRQLLDWPGDVVALLDQMQLKQVHLLAVSGGAPYALICAAKIPERLLRVGIVSGATHPDFLLKSREVLIIYRLLIKLYLTSPGVCLRLLALTARGVPLPVAQFLMPLFTPFLAQADRTAMKDKEKLRLILNSIHAARKMGGKGIAHDGTRYAQDWGFALESISMPVQLWHGTQDRNIPIHTVREECQRMHHATLTEFPDEGHYSLPLNHTEQVLRHFL
ncbi:MAG: alpha/beta hydrolase [Verrucomicrobiota bacterium]|nr:alpha/beta hydrolase [Verrucomicrobiota bacterium]